MGLFTTSCNHKYGKIEDDGYQYCIHCGIANSPDPIKCTHEWEIREQHKIKEGNVVTNAIRESLLFVLQCKNCGELKKKKVDFE